MIILALVLITADIVTTAATAIEDHPSDSPVIIE